MGIKVNFVQLARKSFWIFPGLFIMVLVACSGGVTPIPSTLTPTITLTATPEIATYQLSLEKSIGQGNAQAVDWAPDGKSFVIVTSIKADLYDAESAEITDTLETGQSGLAVKYSPNGRILAIASKDGSVQIWDIAKKQKIHTFTCTGLKWDYGLSQVLSFSSDSKKLAIADDQTVYVLDVSTGKPLDTFAGYEDAIIAVAFNTQGNILLAASTWHVFVRDLSTRELLYPAIRLDGNLASIFFDKTDNNLITVSNLYGSGFSSHISVWDSATGQMGEDYQITGNHIYGATVNLAQGLIVAGDEQEIIIWDMSTNRVTNRMSEQGGWVDSLSISPDGKKLLSPKNSGEGFAKLWDLTTLKEIKAFEQYAVEPSEVAFSSTGKLVAWVGAKHLIEVRDTNTGKRLYTIDGNAPLAFSPDGKILAYGKGSASAPNGTDYRNSQLILVDAETHQALPGKFYCGNVSKVAFSPDGKNIVFGAEHYDGCDLQIRNVESGKLLLDFMEVEGNESLSFSTLLFSPDGNSLVLGGSDNTTVLNSMTGKKISEVKSAWGSINAVSSDGRYLAITDNDFSKNSNIRILDLATNQHIFTLSTSQKTVSQMAFSRNGQLLAIAGEGIELWNVWNGQPLSREQKADEQAIKSLAFNQEGNALLIVKENSAIQHWKIDRESKTTILSRPTPTLIPTLTPTQVIAEVKVPKVAELGKGISSQVYYSPDGKIAAFMDGDDLIWFDGSTFEQLGKLNVENTTGQLVFSPDGRIVVVDTYFGAQIIDLQEKETLGSVSGDNGSTFGYTFTKDIQYMAYGIADRTSGGPYESIGLWDIAKRQRVFKGDPNVEGEYYFPTFLEGRYHVMSAPAISPNGKLVAAGHNDKRVYVWDLQTGEIRYTLEGHAAIVNSVAFSPDGKVLASGSSDGTVRLWNPATGKLIRVLTGFLNDVFDVSFSADGKSLNVGIAKLPDQIVDLQSSQITEAPTVVSTPDPFETRQYLQGYSTRGGTIFSSVTFSPDGKFLAFASQNVLLWDVAEQKLFKFLENPQGSDIRGLVFSPDGKKLAITTDCDEIIAWDLETGNQILSQKSDFLSGATVLYGIGDTELGPARGGSVIAEQGLAFSPDSQSLAFGNDNTIEVWQLAEAKKVATLTNPEGQYATQVSFSADGKHLYSILNRNRGTQIWDVGSGNLVKQVNLTEVGANVYSAIALRGPLFARNNSAKDESSWIELWNLESGKSFKLNMPSAENEPLRFSLDGSLLLAQNNSKIYFWKTDNGQLLYQTNLEGVGTSGLTLSTDNSHLATSSEGKAQLWDVSKVMQLAPSNAIPDFSPHPTTTPVVFAWPTSTPQPTATASLENKGKTMILPNNAGKLEEQARFGQGTIEQITWDPSGNSILVTGSLGNTKYDLDPQTSAMTETSQTKSDGWSYDTVTLLDGRILSVGEANGHIFVWDSTGKALIELEGSGRAAISANGNLLAYQNPDQKLQIWDIQSNTSVITFPNYSFDFYSPVFSPDGSLVAAIKTGYGRYDDSVRVWDIRTSTIANALGGPDNDITDLSFSQDGRFITGAAGGAAWVWDIRPGISPTQIQLYEVEINDNLNIYTQTVTSTALSPNDELVALGTSENQLFLYQRTTHQKLRSFKGLSSPIRKLRFSPDGKMLLSVDEDGLVALWDVVSGKLLTKVDKYLGNVGGLVFQQDGVLSAWGTGTNWLIQPEIGKPSRITHIYSGKILAASPAGDLLAVYNPFQMSLWDVKTEQFKQTLEGEAITPFVEYYWEGLAYRQFYAAAFSADGSRLVTAGAGGIWYYDTSNSRLLKQFDGSNAQKIALSPNGKHMLTSLYDQAKEVSDYDLETGKENFSFKGTGREIFQTAFSPDGQWAGAVQYAWGGPYELILHNLTSDQIIKSMELGKEIPGHSLAINPSSTLIAVGLADGKILLVDLKEMRVLSTLTGHWGPVEHLAFSPDGSYLVSSSTDGTVRTWGVP